MLTQKELLKELHKAVKEAGTQKQWAEQNGISAAYLNDILKGKRAISEKMAKKLGYVPVMAFRKKEGKQ